MRKEKAEKHEAAKVKRKQAERHDFYQRLAKAKKEEENADASTSAKKPAAKKKKPQKSRAKKLPTQKNTLNGYVQKVDTVSVASGTVASVPPKSEVSSTTGSYATPKASRVILPPMITPYSGTHIDTSYHIDLTQSSGSGSVNHTLVCSGCKNPFSSCYEGKWRRICLHRVLDYIEANEFKGATEKGVRKVYYDTFIVMMKNEILDETELYKLEDHIHLPQCMKEGSLNEAIELMDFDVAYEFMKTVRVHDVQRHLAKRNGGVFCGNCKDGERIVRK